MVSRKITKAIPIGGAVLSLLALFTLAACGSNGNAASPQDQGSATINYKVVGSDDGDVGPDGNKHDTFKTPDPTTIKLGQKVTLNFTNTDDMPHSYTLPELGINVMVPGAKDGKDATTSYTFTANKAGTFRWFCAIPCDNDNAGWAMKAGAKGTGQDSFMAGYITVQ